MQLDKENIKNPMAHRICNSLISGCPEPAHSHQHCQSSAWLSLSVHHWFRNRFYPQYSNEIHRTSSVRKSLETREKTAQKLARPVSLVLSICFVICIIVIVMLVVVPTGGNIRKHSEKDRRKYSGFSEMDRQCIRKQSGSCEMGAVS